MSTIAEQLDRKLEDITGRIENFVKRLSTTRSLQESLDEGAARVAETARELNDLVRETRAATKSLGDAETALL